MQKQKKKILFVGNIKVTGKKMKKRKTRSQTVTIYEK